ncbi:endonuclease/exonuclease/phosphatase family protein [Mariniflexile sp.]|uniref:endonuclease/exonuclease/phosphatase family protein n=1 Tax=Mariniflexile sp. TaxID=1979402 RepID=UPI00404872DA
MTEYPENIEVRHDLQTVAFYNLENLFDIDGGSQTNNNGNLPTSVKKWTPKRYENKLIKLGFAISNIGKKETGKHPALVGLAEVENAKAIENLIASKHLKNCNYHYLHYESLDERGIDVALLYDTTAFKVTHSEAFQIDLINEHGLPDNTRDALLVSGLLDGEQMHIIVNHWSSRRDGKKETEHKRMVSADKVGYIITSLRQENPDAKIIVVGDFNDDPSSNSIKHLVEGHDLFNPVETLLSYKRGSTVHNRVWKLFDQILISTNFFKNAANRFEYETANIFDEDFLKLLNGKFKGAPFRTYVGLKYKGGYSDHFPVYAIFKK